MVIFSIERGAIPYKMKREEMEACKGVFLEKFLEKFLEEFSEAS
jgi:hypothetical protein